MPIRKHSARIAVLAALTLLACTVPRANAQTPVVPHIETLTPATDHGQVNTVAFSPDGMWLATGSHNDSKVTVWNVTATPAVEARTITNDTDPGRIYSVDFSPNSQMLGMGGFHGIAKVFGPATGTLIWGLAGSDNGRIGFGPNNAYVAIGGSSGSVPDVLRYDLSNGELVQTLSGHTATVLAVDYSPDGTTVASGSADTTAIVWNIGSGAPAYTLTDHTGAVGAVAFSPDGLLLATGSDDFTVKLWNAASGAFVRTLTGHTGIVTDLDFRHDSLLLVSSSDDATVRLWDVATGDLVIALSSNDGPIGGPVQTVAFSPDGLVLATGDSSTPATTELWDVSLGPAIAITAPMEQQVLPPGTTSTPLTVVFSDHASPGHWHWQDTPFAATGVASGEEVPPDVFTAPIDGLVDDTEYTVYVALVDDATGGDLLVDADAYPASRASVTFSVAGPPAVTIVTPTQGQELAVDTTEIPLTVTILNHPESGRWGYQLDLGTGPGPMVPVPSGTEATLTELVNGVPYTATVSLLDDSDALLSPAVAASVDFSVGPILDAITVLNAQGQVAGTTTVAITVADLTGLGVSAVELVLTYDDTILTPQDDGTNTTAATATALVPVDWSIAQNVPSPGELRVALAGESVDPIVGGGTLVTLTFDVSPTATIGATSPLTLTTASLNEGDVTSIPVHGTFTVTQFMYGDVTGNGSVSPYDATWVLDCVATELVGGTSVFPVETITPPWSTVPLTPEEAREVADVDDDGAITANDAVVILRYVVGLVPDLPLPVVPPSPSATLTTAALDITQTSERPGALITVSLDASAMPDVHAGELVLEFDAALLRPVGVSLGGDGASQPLLTRRVGDGRIAVAFASVRPVASGSALDVTFQVSRAISAPTDGAIRATHLRLNRSLIATTFAYAFHVEPFQTRLMTNYPNPFNPETWIPFELSQDADVSVRIYGLDGSIVRTLDLGYQPMGEYRARESAAYWDGRNDVGERVASGVYVYELRAGDQRDVKRMVISK